MTMGISHSAWLSWVAYPPALLIRIKSSTYCLFLAWMWLSVDCTDNIHMRLNETQSIRVLMEINQLTYTTEKLMSKIHSYVDGKHACNTLVTGVETLRLHKKLFFSRLYDIIPLHCVIFLKITTTLTVTIT